MEKLRQIIDPKDIDAIIYHHPCPDGYSAAFVASLYIPGIILIPTKINPTPLDYELIKDKNVIMIDIVTHDYEVIKSHAKNLIILDHHLSNQKKLENVPFAYFDMHKSGVGLAWEFFFKTDDKMPLFLKAVQDRDIWSWSQPESRNFTDGLYEELDLDDFAFTIFTNLMDEFLEKIPERPLFMKYYNLGETLNRIKQKNINILLKNANNRYEVNVPEETPKKYVAYIFNVTGSFTSDLGNYVASNLECDFVIIWSYNHNDEKYSYSLRSIDSKADVSIIANAFGGGGHRNAAGLSSLMHPKELFSYKKI